MTEAAGSEARTIHRLLEYGFGTEGFSKNEDNPILADVVIVDEMSMVDVPLMHSLLRALHPDTRLIMVGDADQLPPVGAGNVLRDIISSGTVPFIRLTEIFRQEEKSLIVANAHRINKGHAARFGPDRFGFRFLIDRRPGRDTHPGNRSMQKRVRKARIL
jgi:exodeoxyribonuclease V alpha subunit